MSIKVSDKLYYDLMNDLNSKTILQEGGKLLTEPVLSKRYNVAIGTLRKAVSRLETEGFVERQQGRGTFITAKPENICEKPLYTANYSLHCQDEINNFLIGNTCRIEDESITSSVQPNDWQQIAEKDFVFLSPHVLHSCGSERFFPLPSSLADKVESDYDLEIPELFKTTHTGELCAVPVIANPVVAYLNTKMIENAGASMPPKDWTWDDLTTTARALKKTGIAPIILVPAPGCLFEPVLKQAGTEIINDIGEVVLEEKAFTEAMKFLRMLLKEGLAIDGYRTQVSYPALLSAEKSAITFCGPLVGNRIAKDKRADWTYFPLPQAQASGGIITTFGVALPRKNGNKALFPLLEKEIYEKNMPRLANLSGAFPARNSEAALWRGAGLNGSEAVEFELHRASAMPSRISEYFSSINSLYAILTSVMNGKTEIADGRKQVIEILK